MTLYRHDATGFIGNFVAAPPGAGYTEIPDASHGPLASVTEWWRAIDRGSLTSDWHPSLLGGTEIPKPPNLAGSGINIMAARYSSFEEPDGLPPIFTNGCTVERLPGGFHGGQKLRITATADDGEVWLAPTGDTYNIRLTPNLRWIFSAYLSAPVIHQPFTALISTASANGGSGTTYTVDGTTGAIAGSWDRRKTLLDLRQESASAGLLGFRLPTAGAILDVDAIMVEELLGDTVQPSAYYAPPILISGEQVVPQTISYSKAVQGLEFLPQSPSAIPVIVWTPVAPAARVRGNITISAILEVERPINDSQTLVTVTFIREGVVAKTVRHSLLVGQEWAVLSSEWLDQSLELNAIHYQIGVHCPDELILRGVGKIFETKR